MGTRGIKVFCYRFSFSVGELFCMAFASGCLGKVNMNGSHYGEQARGKYFVSLPLSPNQSSYWSVRNVHEFWPGLCRV